MSLHVETLRPDADLADWQRFVDAQAGAGPLHHAGWLRVIARSFAVTPHWLIARDKGGAVAGLLPMYEARSLLLGSELTSLEGGILATDAAAVNALFEAAEGIRTARRLPRLVLRGGAVPVRASAGTVQHVHSLVDTRGTPDATWTALRSNTRRKVNRAERDDIRVVLDPGAVPAFYDVYARTVHGLGTPVMARSYFSSLSEALAEHIRFFAVYDRGRMVGGMLAVDHGRMRSSLYVAVEDEAMRRYASYALYWTVIADCLRSEMIDTLDLGRSVVASGTYQFKQQWAARDLWIAYVSYGKPAAPAAQPGRGSVKAKLWSSLPLAACNYLGPKLRRTLPFG